MTGVQTCALPISSLYANNVLHRIACGKDGFKHLTLSQTAREARPLGRLVNSASRRCLLRHFVSDSEPRLKNGTCKTKLKTCKLQPYFNDGTTTKTRAFGWHLAWRWAKKPTTNNKTAKK